MNAESPAVQVAVGIIRDADGSILIARRPDHAHQGGLWEFPGGKVEAAESVETALRRELHEEIGIIVQMAEPWLQVRHAYVDKSVLLEVWRVTAWRGDPHGREGQPLAWVLPEKLGNFSFPAADAPIIACLCQEPDQITQQASSKEISVVL